jgi:hypothetical protein
MEPNMSLEERKETAWMGQADILKSFMMASALPDLDYQFGKGLVAKYGQANEVPAKNARFFQGFTGMLSKIAWCFPLLILAYRQRKVNSIHPSTLFPANYMPTGIEHKYAL